MRRWSLAAVLAALACTRSASPPDPGPAAASVAAPASVVAPAPVAAPAPGPAAPPDAATRPCPPPKTAAAFRQDAKALLERRHDPYHPRDPPAFARLEPLWPTRWPAEDGGVGYWIYDSEVLGTGMICHGISGPTHAITYASLAAAPELRSLGRGKALGRECEQWYPQVTERELALAEQSLLDIVAGCRSPEAARAAFAPYTAWLREHPEMARDLERRVPRFTAWLKRATPGR